METIQIFNDNNVFPSLGGQTIAMTKDGPEGSQGLDGQAAQVGRPVAGPSRCCFFVCVSCLVCDVFPYVFVTFDGACVQRVFPPFSSKPCLFHTKKKELTHKCTYNDDDKIKIKREIHESKLSTSCHASI